MAENIPARLSAFRNAAGLSRAKLSELSGVPVRTLENWEGGARLPRDVYQIWAVAHALGLTVEQYIGLDEKGPA